MPPSAQPDHRSVPVDAVLDFLGVLRAVDHALQIFSKRLHATRNVTGPQRMVLRIVGRFPGIPSGEVASILRIHPSTLTGIVARLNQRGLLQQRDDPRDRRRTLLGLTPRGRELDIDEGSAIDEIVARVLATGTANEVDATRKILARLAVAFEGAIGPPNPARARMGGTRATSRVD